MKSTYFPMQCEPKLRVSISFWFTPKRCNIYVFTSEAGTIVHESVWQYISSAIQCQYFIVYLLCGPERKWLWFWRKCSSGILDKRPCLWQERHLISKCIRWKWWSHVISWVPSFLGVGRSLRVFGGWGWGVGWRGALAQGHHVEAAAPITFNLWDYHNPLEQFLASKTMCY